MTFIERIKARFSRPEPLALPSQAMLDVMTVDELNALNQAMERKQAAIRAERQVIARTVDAKLTEGR